MIGEECERYGERERDRNKRKIDRTERKRDVGWGGQREKGG